jgi:hypothetical protein
VRDTGVITISQHHARMILTLLNAGRVVLFDFELRLCLLVGLHSIEYHCLSAEHSSWRARECLFCIILIALARAQTFNQTRVCRSKNLQIQTDTFDPISRRGGEG